MNKDTISLIKESTSTFWNIAQMTQYRVQYAQKRNSEDRYRMFKHAIIAGIGIASLFMAGITSLMDNPNNDNRVSFW